MYNLIKYSDNYADSSGSLYQFKRNESPINGAGNPNNDALDNCMVLILGDNVNNRETTFKITSTKLYVPVVTLSTKDNVNLAKQLNEGFKRSVYWNEYKSKIETKTADNNNLKIFLLDASFQGVNRLFVLAFNNTNNDDNMVERNSHRKYFLPKVNITNYNVLIDGRSFYDQPINDQIKKYDEIRKTGKGDDYIAGCLLDYQYFKDHYQLIAVDLSKQKELDVDPRAIQQIEFYGKLETNSQVCTVLEKSKETVLEFYKGVPKVL